MEWLWHRRKPLAALLLITLLVVQMPARPLQWLFPRDRLVLSGLTGTLWSGNATRAWLVVDDQPLMLGRVDWQFRPWRLLWSEPLSVTTSWGDQVFQTDLGVRLTGRLVMSDARINFDTEVLRRFLPIYLGGSAGGRFEHVVWGPQGIEDAQGVISLRDTVWTARSGLIPLGSYRVDLRDAPTTDEQTAKTASPETEVVKGIVSTEDGSLQLDGIVSLSQVGYDVSLSAKGPVAKDEGFLRAVSVVATPTADGFDVVLQGAL